ncbi:MAG: hypothetical protein NXH85_08970 [Pseudomonadaceae bacterium]|nr:hypothetical protein [Pseudomonadaceae bacterium]
MIGSRWFRTSLLALGLALAGCGDSNHGDLDADSVLALEIGVVSILASPNAMFPVTASDALMQRVQHHEGLRRDVSAFGMMGQGRIISDGPARLLLCRISGPINASVEVRNGEVGLREGEIYIAVGTLLTNAEGQAFSFRDGSWHEEVAQERVDAERAHVISVRFNASKVSQFGLSDDDVKALQDTVEQGHGRRAINTQNTDDLIQTLIDLPVRTLADGAELRLGDIALIQAEFAEPGSNALVFYSPE